LLVELGYGEAEIERLIAAKVIPAATRTARRTH